MTAMKDAANAVVNSSPATRSLGGSLGTGSIVFMVVAAAAPLTVVGGSTPLGILLGNGVGFPTLFAIAAVVLGLFSVGLAAMTRKVPKPGGFFTFVGYGLGRPAGVATAYLAVLTYTTVQVAVYGYLGYLLEVTFVGLGLPDLPWYLYSLAMVALVAVLGYRHIELSSRVLGVLLIAEVAIVLALVAAVVIDGGPEGLSLAPFEPAAVLWGSPGVGLVFALAAFIGFEATTIFRDEARTPDRTIPRATYIAVIGIGLFYTLASWGVVMAWGPSGVVDAAAADPGSLVILTTANYLGDVGQIILQVLLITSMFACVLSFHNVLTRYQHAMSNVELLPSGLGAVHSRHGSPYRSSLTQSVTAAVLIVLFAILGLDPVLQVFTWLAGVTTLAIALLMAVTSVAIIVFFVRTRSDGRIWNTIVAPALGLLGLVVAAGIIALNFPMLVGDVDAQGAPAFGLTSLILLGVIVLLPAIGVVQALVLKAKRPDSYERITETIAG